MIKILGLFPMNGNGGIASWTKKFLSTFPDENFKIFPIDVAPSKDFTKYTGADRVIYGIKTYYRIKRNVKKTLKDNPDIEIMHITTSGGLGSIRDNMVVKICKRHHVKTIMHCRFGTIKELYEGKKMISRVFRKNVSLFDSTWVLDKRSETFLKSIPEIADKIELTPNSIEVPGKVEIVPKNYKKIGFIGNIVPTKGIFELIEAVVNINNDTQLYIAGIGSEDIVNKLKTIAGNMMGRTIHFIGRLPNTEAVKLIESLDIISLPTYYPGEAFPISILEGMSRGKLIISCPRAAIPDMLTALDGTKCGLLVPEKDSEAIFNAIKWCQDNKEAADKMCVKAYEKVLKSYSKEVVYEVYKGNYLKLIS